MKQAEITAYLQTYQGDPVTIMEVCGSHTAAIAKHGLRSLVSDRIRLVSGPGCPVCVTPSSYIDRLISLAQEPDTTVVTFGDMLRVPGSRESLSLAKTHGASVRMVYSPMDILKLAKKEPGRRFIFAAVGFETTTPVYALLLDCLIRDHIENVQLLTALKTMPEAISWLCSHQVAVDAFLAPGHVSVITGSEVYRPIAARYGLPFGVAGFQAEELLIAIYGLVRKVEKLRTDKGTADVYNYYPAVVTPEGNTKAQEKIRFYFEKSDAVWRGMGAVEGSGQVLKQEFARFDAGSRGLVEDHKFNEGCCCGQVLLGKMRSVQCPLFGKVCTPQTPQGACMVSFEGSCYQQYMNLEAPR